MMRNLGFMRIGWIVGAWLLVFASPDLRAGASREDIDWLAAKNLINQSRWTEVDKQFGEFINRFPESPRYPEAVLYQVEARIHQKKYTEAVDLLFAQQGRAGEKVDEFAYWLGQAYHGNSNFQAAADAYAGLLSKFPSSKWRAEAIFCEADARLNMGETNRVVEALRQQDGPFQQMVRTDPTNEWVVRTAFKLCEMELKSKHFEGAEQALALLPAQKLQPELEWNRQYLACRVMLEGGRPAEAMQNINKLFEAATGNATNKTRSIFMWGTISRNLGDYPAATAAYETNLNNTNLTTAERREALLRTVEMDLAQDLPDRAAGRLEEFTARNPDEKGSDLYLLMVGELRLKLHYLAKAATNTATGGGTNHLQPAKASFEALITKYANSDFFGRAQLNLGWCFAEVGSTNQSQLAFSNAVERLPASSEHRAVALFKLGESMLARGDAAGAAGNFNRVIDEYGSMPSVTNDLFEPALYQLLRASVAQTNLADASNALSKILAWFPEGFLGEPGVLLLGQALNRDGRAAEAREVFSNFTARWPQSPLAPEARLAIARTYEQEDDWGGVISQYKSWVTLYTNHPSYPRALFSLAWAYYADGQDTNAFGHFSAFIDAFSTNELELAPRAYFWMGDYHFGRQDYIKAETSYQAVSKTNYPVSPLTFEARMAEGRVAVARVAFVTAAEKFAKLATNAQAPLELQLEARLACGDATVWSAPTNPTNLGRAVNIFGELVRSYPTHPSAPRAWGAMGNCYLQLGAQSPSNYLAASNAYLRVVEATNLANITLRSQAEYGVGQTLEKMARATNDLAIRKQFLDEAVNHYLNVLNGNNLQPGETKDLTEVARAGYEAGRLLEDMDKWEVARGVYETMREFLPPLQKDLDQKIANARKHLQPQGN